MSGPQTRKSTKLSIFANWEFKNNIISPVIANLLTALILFFSVAIFKDPIYDWIRPTQSVPDFPIYCVAEGYNDREGSKIFADIYIINLAGDSLTRSEIDSFLKLRSSTERERPPDPDIRFKGSVSLLHQSEADLKFNQGKGELEILKLGESESAEWIVRIKEIQSKAVLRITVETNVTRPIERNAKVSLPFEVVYPGR
jgi:hypothetical protein